MMTELDRQRSNSVNSRGDKIFFSLIIMHLCLSRARRRSMMAKSGNRCAVHRMYAYMAPSYVPPEDDRQQSASYHSVLDALVENSSAHGLPTLYRARGSHHVWKRIYFHVSFA